MQAENVTWQKWAVTLREISRPVCALFGLRQGCLTRIVRRTQNQLIDVGSDNPYNPPALEIAGSLLRKFASIVPLTNSPLNLILIRPGNRCPLTVVDA